jgi:tetratricopeptide (TPR) repeat protein
MALLQEGNLPKVRQGADELRQAVQYDPTFALAWAGLADAAILLDPTTGDIAIDYAEKAVRLNPDCGECHAILGRLLFSTKWQWEQAGIHLDKAVALKRDDPDILMARAEWEAALGRTTQALEILDRVGRRFPQKLNTGAVRAQYLYYGRKYESVILESDRLTAMNLSSGLEWKANALFQLGRYAEAVYALHGFLGSWSSASPETIANRRNAAVTRFEQAGLPGVMGDLLRLTASPPAAQVHAHNRARWLMLLGKHEQAVNELQVGLHVGLGDMIFLNVEPVFDPIRSNPEFRKLLKKLRLA